MLDQLGAASTLLSMCVVVLLVVLLYQSVRIRRIEGFLRERYPGADKTLPELQAEPPLQNQLDPEPPLLPSSPPDAPATADQVESIGRLLETVSTTLAIIAARERPLAETKLLDWPFDDAVSLIRHDDQDLLSSQGKVVCRFLIEEAPEHAKLFLELIEKGEAAAAIEVSKDVTALSLQLASCGIHIAINGHFLIGSVVAVLAHAKIRQIGRKVDHVKDQLQFLIDARTAEHDASLRSLWEIAREQSSRPREPDARRRMRHIAEELSRLRFIWIYDFHQVFITAARHMYKGAEGEKKATETHVPSCRATAERLVIAITLDYFVRLALEEPKGWLNARLVDEANHVKGTINRCLTEWRNHRPKKRSRATTWNREARLRRHQTMSQAIGQLRLYQRVLTMLAKAPEQALAIQLSEASTNPAAASTTILLTPVSASGLPASAHVH